MVFFKKKRKNQIPKFETIKIQKIISGSFSASFVGDKIIEKVLKFGQK